MVTSGTSGQPPTRLRRWSVTTWSPPTCALVEAVDPARLGRRRRRPGRARARGRHRRGPRARHAGQPSTTRELTPYDRYGNRIDEVALPPVLALADGARGRPRPAGGAVGAQDAGPHAHVRRAAGFLAWSQTEPGHGCPISMTYAAVPALRADDALAKEWTPLLASTIVRPRAPAAVDQARRAGRHGHDREAGRLRRPRQRHRGAADPGRRRVHPARPQVVHLGADERRLPGARPGRPAG